LKCARWNARVVPAQELARFEVTADVLTYDGGAHRTMLRNDAFWFSRIGLLSNAPTTRRGCSTSNIVPFEKGDRHSSPDYFNGRYSARRIGIPPITLSHE
jgi:hypothetical protein